MKEYKVVPAPTSAPKVRGLKTLADRFAHALSEFINAEAAGGWEFVRAEQIGCDQRSALGKVTSVPLTMMVFSRPLGVSRPDASAALAALQAPTYREAPVDDGYAAPPVYAAPAAPAARREPLFRAGATLRGDTPLRAEPVLRPRYPVDDPEA